MTLWRTSGGPLLKTSGGGLVKAATVGSEMPLLASTDISYVGSFRMPTDWGYSNHGLAFNPANNSLFVSVGAGAYAGYVGEMSIPTPGAGTSFSGLPQATALQTYTEISEGRFKNITGLPDSSYQPDRLGGLLVYDGELYCNYHRVYGSNCEQSHLVRPLDLSDTGNVRGWYKVKSGVRWNGFTAGAMCEIPDDWKTALGKNALTGCNTLSLMSGEPGESGSGLGRSSWGPSAFAFNPEDLVGADGTSVEATNIISYDKLHYFFGESGDVQGTTYTHWSQASGPNGIVFPGGSTRTFMFFGLMATGSYEYAVITDNPALDGLPCDLPGEEGRLWNYDPAAYLTNPNEHANTSYPYRMKCWAYDANDMVAVKNGTMNYYDIEPYGEWILDYPAWLPESASAGYYTRTNTFERIYGAAFDPATRRVYLHVNGDQTNGSRAILVYALPA